MDKYNNKNDFEFIGNGVYKNLKDGNFKIALSYELENGAGMPNIRWKIFWINII